MHPISKPPDVDRNLVGHSGSEDAQMLAAMAPSHHRAVLGRTYREVIARQRPIEIIQALRQRLPHPAEIMHRSLLAVDEHVDG